MISQTIPDPLIECLTTDLLADRMRQAGKPVSLQALARVAVQSGISITERCYAPGASYTPDDCMRYHDQVVQVISVEHVSNPVQGHFQIVHLLLPDTTTRTVASNIAGAPDQDRQRIADNDIHHLVDGSDAPVLWEAIETLLHQDARFLAYDYPQGRVWCVHDLLPPIDDQILSKVMHVLPKTWTGNDRPTRAIEELVLAAWGIINDGRPAYDLYAFALSHVLSRRDDVVSFGDRWAWMESWRACTARRSVSLPRMHTQIQIPTGVQPIVNSPYQHTVHRTPIHKENAQIPSPDWRTRRRRTAVCTLHPHHFYEGWIPLSKDLTRIFPPSLVGRQEITFHHRFAMQPGSFHAWVDHHQKRIWLSREMGAIFQEHAIYPGARLSITYRNDTDYDLSTRPARRTDPIHVWRMWLEDGQITYSLETEPRRYDIQDDVFVAGARYEDLPALFQQAAEAGNSIFGLIYQKAVEWWEQRSRQKTWVTVDELFQAIHFDEHGRMTSKHTIAWELWRRQAFQSVGGGNYLFRPEYGDVLHIPASVRSSPVSSPQNDMDLRDTSAVSTLPADHHQQARSKDSPDGDETDQSGSDQPAVDATTVFPLVHSPAHSVPVSDEQDEPEITPDDRRAISTLTKQLLRARRVVGSDIFRDIVSYPENQEHPTGTSTYRNDNDTVVQETDVLWSRLGDLEGKELRTLPHLQAFRITSVRHDAVIILMSATQRGRYIPRTDIERLWNNLRMLTDRDVEDIWHAVSSTHAPYILSMLVALMTQQVRTILFDTVLSSVTRHLQRVWPHKQTRR